MAFAMQPIISTSKVSFPWVNVGSHAERKLRIPRAHLLIVYVSREVVMFDKR